MATRRLRITKEPQCRHSESQGFVSYTGGASGWLAHCSNCASSTSTLLLTKEEARLELMRIEAPPIVVP